MQTRFIIQAHAFSLPGVALWLCLGGWAAAQEEETARPVDALSQSALQNAFQILRGEYIRGAELGYDELNRAAFQGLLERLELGAELVPRTQSLPALVEKKIRFERLTPEVLCLRPCVWDESTAPEMRRVLTEHAGALRHLILDLRCPAPPGEFETAAAVLELFLPPGELMFKLKQPGREDARLFIASETPAWTRPVVLLVDEDTGNLGETTAAVLRARGQGLIVGTRTRGATVRYEILPLDDAWLLRFARAEMLLADGGSLFRKGLAPDFPVEMQMEKKRAFFGQGGSMKEHIFDTAQPRFNEAALLARKNPELDSYIRRSVGRDDPIENTRTHDTVLQRAVDMLLMHGQLSDSRIQWPDAKNKKPAPTVKKAQPAGMP